jgi:hypothetical protein
MTAKKVNVNVTRKPAVTGPVRELKVPVRVSEPAPVSDIDTVLADRGSRYGKFVGHAAVTQQLKRLIAEHLDRREKELVDDQQEALDMICHKIGRIINGDANYADSWVDIAGYAKLVADRLEGKSV